MGRIFVIEAESEQRSWDQLSQLRCCVSFKSPDNPPQTDCAVPTDGCDQGTIWAESYA